MRKLLSSMALVGLLLAGASAMAQPRPKTVEMPKIVVRGTPPAPQAVYVLDRSRSEAELTKLRRSFVARIVSSVERAPF